jgi:hypothetical protein
MPRDGTTLEDGKQVDPKGSTVVRELATEAREIPPMMMAHERRRLIADHSTRHQAPVENVQVASTV